jgi:hypothetical protein
MGDVSPTHKKEFRFCLNKGMYNKLETKEHSFNIIITEELKKYHHLLEKINIKYEERKDCINQSFI